MHRFGPGAHAPLMQCTLDSRSYFDQTDLQSRHNRFADQFGPIDQTDLQKSSHITTVSWISLNRSIQTDRYRSTGPKWLLKHYDRRDTPPRGMWTGRFFPRESGSDSVERVNQAHNILLRLCQKRSPSDRDRLYISIQHFHDDTYQTSASFFSF
jgi:hypothetical protein